MTEKDATTTLVAMDVLHAWLDDRTGAQADLLIEQHGERRVIAGMAAMLETLGRQGCGDVDTFRGLLRSWAVELQLMTLTAAPVGGEG